MAVELITGHKGAVHVDAADDAALYAAIAGKGEYVLQLGSQLACTMATANKAHIASGHGLMQGRHWLVDAEGADVTIENGTQGQKRNDLIVARYERDAANGNVESVVLRAIKGTPTTGAAADPSYVHGDVLGSGALVNEQPLYRIPLDGITVGKPVRLFEVLTPQKDAWDSVSQRTTTTKTASITVSPQSSNTASINTGISRSKLPTISGWEQGTWELSVHRVKLVEREGQMQVQISLYNPLSKSMASNITVFIDHM